MEPTWVFLTSVFGGARIQEGPSRGWDGSSQAPGLLTGPRLHIESVQ